MRFGTPSPPDETRPSRRLLRLVINPSHLCRLLASLQRKDVVVQLEGASYASQISDVATIQLPHDVTVVDVEASTPSTAGHFAHEVQIVIEHPSFPRVFEGNLIPECRLLFREHRGTEALYASGYFAEERARALLKGVSRGVKLRDEEP